MSYQHCVSIEFILIDSSFLKNGELNGCNGTAVLFCLWNFEFLFLMQVKNHLPIRRITIMSGHLFLCPGNDLDRRTHLWKRWGRC